MKFKTTVNVLFVILLVIQTKAETTSIFQTAYTNLKTNSQQNWLQVKTQDAFTKAQFLNSFNKAYELNEHFSFKEKEVQNDEINWKHYRMQQHYKNIPIDGADFIIHETNGIVESANGFIFKHMNLGIVPAISKELALELLLEEIDAQKYAWEDEQHEQMAKKANSQKPSYYPSGELVIIEKDFDFNKNNFIMAYKFDVFSIEPLERYYYYVDAHTGDIINKLSRIHTNDTQGNAQTNYYGNVTITTDSFSGIYRLREQGRGKGIETFTANNTESYPLFDCTDADNNWTSNNTKTCCEAHWGSEQTYDYFLNEHNRNSYDNNGAKLLSWVNFSTNYANAFWNGTHMTYGDGNGGSIMPLTSIDIVGHEITHAVIERTAGLRYMNESGALNESFADIFGTAIEFKANPSGADWLVGEDAFKTRNGIRNMQNPNSKGQPDTYKGNLWYDGLGDNGGVHFNSGVQNYWFYLLSEGGTGTNDNGDNFNVTGIGMQKAAKITYRNLTVYLISGSEYADAREGAIKAATDLYGTNSNEVQQVKNAWCAVGVGACVESDKVIILASPNGTPGDDEFLEGSTKEIVWFSSGDIPNVRLEYSLNNGASWQTITASTANDSSYDWQLPFTSTALALVRVSDVNDFTVNDVSDFNFSIISACSAACFQPNTLTVCEGESITFSNCTECLQGSCATIWSIDGFRESGDYSFTHVFNDAGAYNVCLDVISSDCTTQSCQRISVNSSATSTFTYVENGLNIGLTADDSNGTSYTWSSNGTNIGSQKSINYTFSSSGNYNVCLSVGGSCASGPSCQVIQVANNLNCGESWTIYETANSNIPHNNIMELMQRSNGDIYIGSVDGDFAYLDAQTNNFTVFTPNNSDLPHEDVTSIVDGRAGVVVGTINGLAKFDGTSFNFWDIYKTTTSDIPNNFVRAVLQATNSQTYVGTLTGGLTQFDGISANGWTIYNTSNSNIPTNNISILAQGINNSIWLGTSSNGLIQFDGNNSFTQYTTDNSQLTNNQIYDIIQTNNGTVFAGTNNGGLVKFNGTNGNSWTNFSTSNSDLPSNTVLSLLEMSNGDIYAGTNEGVGVFNGNDLSGWTIYNTSNSDLPSNIVHDIIEGNSGEIIIGTLGGLAILSKGANNFRFSPSPDVIDCNLNSTTLDARIAGMQYTWVLDGEVISTQQQLTVSQSGVYTITIITPCSQQFSADITVILADVACVWPGDLNFDGQVSVQDIVPFGLYFGESSYPRSQQSQQWQAFPALDWDAPQINNNDIKHIDADGSGTIDLFDYNVIQNNLNLTHTQSNAETPIFNQSPIKIYTQLSQAPAFSIGNNEFAFDVIIENIQGDDVAVYGGSFEIDYSVPGVDISNANVEFDFRNSWLMNTVNDVLFIVNNNEAEQKIEVGFTRIDRSNSIGTGVVASFAGLIDNITILDPIELQFHIDDIRINNSEGIVLPIQEKTTAITIEPDGTYCNADLSLYPTTDLNYLNQSSGTITTNGAITVPNNTILKANEVILNEGFEVPVNTNFEILPEPCE